ncbi:MAG: hypothetical protein ACTS4T_01240 [Candidatus Hodgkinia cicadicola]
MLIMFTSFNCIPPKVRMRSQRIEDIDGVKHNERNVILNLI